MTVRRLARALTAVGATLAAVCTVLLPALPAHAATVSANLRGVVAGLPVADESRTGYSRTLFRHWVDEDSDGCHTRNEVLLAEAVVAPPVSAGCVLGEGQWYSYYDDQYRSAAGTLDIDHMVPLAEAWDSGASAWTAQRRQAYANDLGDDRALVAVTASSNRAKSDQDPSEWMPPYVAAHCRYLEEWVAVKIRWGLTVDAAEHQVLVDLAAACPDNRITVETVP